MGKSFKWWLRASFVSLTVGFVIGWGGGATIADAYMLRNLSGCSPDTYFTFSFWEGDRAWTTNEKNRVELGAEEWEKVPDPFGGVVTNIVRQPDATIADWQYKIEDLSPDGYMASMSCSNRHVLYDFIDPVAPPLTNAEMRGLGAHETGHALDLRHSGYKDSFDTSYQTLPTQFPTMGTCDSSFSVKATIEQDDYANLEYRYFGRDDAHANTSFETGTTEFWGRGGGANWSVPTSGGNDGPHYVKVKDSYGGYIYQTVRVTAPKDMRARVNYRKQSSLSTGQVFFGIYAREVTYPATVPGTCEEGAGFPSNWDVNEPNVANTTFVFRKGLWVSPTTSWDFDDTPEWTAVDPWMAVDARIRIYNYMTLEGDPTTVRIDYARIRHT